MIAVSSCLLGINCTYEGKNNATKKAIDLFKKGKAVPICPEQLGGLTTPRSPAEISGGKVITKDGEDVTAQFEKGAKEGLKIAIMAGCEKAILKSCSPSCGSEIIHDGAFSGKLVNGDGVFAKLLKENGIDVITEE